MRWQKQHLFVALMIGVLVCCGVGLWSVQNLLLADFFPQESPRLEYRNTPYFAQKRELFLQLFGIDIYGGRFAVLQKFGRPGRSWIQHARAPETSTDAGQRQIYSSHYVYPGLELQFLDDFLSKVEITGSQWEFPLGIRIGDLEMKVYERLGDPGEGGETGPNYRHVTPEKTELSYYLGSWLKIDISGGRVSRISLN
jgi:hypothetical protein